MHPYTTNGKNKTKVISWLAFTSTIIAPILTAVTNNQLQQLSAKFGNISFSAISISATVVFKYKKFIITFIQFHSLSRKPWEWRMYFDLYV